MQLLWGRKTQRRRKTSSDGYREQYRENGKEKKKKQKARVMDREIKKNEVVEEQSKKKERGRKKVGSFFQTHFSLFFIPLSISYIRHNFNRLFPFSLFHT